MDQSQRKNRACSIDKSANYIQDLILKFYGCALVFLNLWKKSFEETPIFNWINLYQDGIQLRSLTIFQDLNMVKHSNES